MGLYMTSDVQVVRPQPLLRSQESKPGALHDKWCSSFKEVETLPHRLSPTVYWRKPCWKVPRYIKIPPHYK